MPNPICTKCQREMSITAIGVVAQFNAVAVSGGAYQQFHADVATCPSCAVEIVFRYAERPSWEHFYAVAPEPPYAIARERRG